MTVLVLSNNSSIDPGEVAQQVADLFLDLEESSPIDVDLESDAGNFVHLANEVLDRYVGRYLHNRNYYVRNILNRNDTLFFIREEQGGRESPLLPLGKNKFQLGTFENIHVVFDSSDKEHVMKISVDGVELDVLRRFTDKDYLPSELKELVGAYYSEELKTLYHLRIENESLIVEHPKIGIVPLSPIQEDGFLTSAWQFSFLEFERDEYQKVRGFRISENRVNKVLFAKLP